MKVWIDDSCTGCRLCEELCPEVFQVDERASVIDENVEGFEDIILDAAEECPVEAIVIEDDDWDLDDDDDEEDEDEDFVEEDEI
jgi:ferredoxin